MNQPIGKWQAAVVLFVCSVCTVGALTFSTASPLVSDGSPFIGRWDLTMSGSSGDYPGWLEVRLSGRQTLVGAFVGQVGSARPISEIKVGDGKMAFAVPPQWERRSTDMAFTARLENDMLVGETTDPKGQVVTWKGVRAPSLVRTNEPQWGTPIELFNGNSLTGWTPRAPQKTHGWVVKEGVLVNAKPGVDIQTAAKFKDFKLHAEFRYPKGSNSGVYLRGRYEVQIEDNFGQEADSHKIGGVYGHLTPNRNAGKEAGEWQEIDIQFVGRIATVVLNGEKVLDRQTIPGITGGALDSNEGEPGPILIQGDHGVVEFRKLTLTPAE